MSFHYESDFNAVLNNSFSSQVKKSQSHGRNKSFTKSQKDQQLKDQQNTQQQTTNGQQKSHANGKFTCECTICLEQTKPEYHLDVYQNQLDVREHLYQGFHRDFYWFMQHLLPINDKIRGCELIIPDTVLFQKGKPKVIIKNDKEYCLMAVRQLSKLNLQSIYKDFSNVVRERKKDFAWPFHKLYGSAFSGLGALFKNSDLFGTILGAQGGKQNAANNEIKLSFLDQITGGAKGTQQQQEGKYASAKDFTEENLMKNRIKNGSPVLERASGSIIVNNATNAAIDKNIYYKDVALIRYKPDEQGDSLVQVVNETGFMQTFQRRANESYWKTVSCIQTNVKSKTGCGTPIIIKFYAPVNYEDPEEEITYDYKSIGVDEDLLKTDQHQYCLKQCYKMCYYIQKVYNFEILKMRTEFNKDENGTIWFFFASQIVTRPVKGKGHLVQTKKVNYVNHQQKTHLLEQLEKHQEQARENNSQNIQKMYEIMGEHYENLKNQVGLKEVFENSDSDEQTEEIFKKLRPQSPYRFKDLIQNQFDPKKFNRQLGKSDKTLDHEQVKDMILYNRPVSQRPKKRYDKQQYAQLQDNGRMVHNMVEQQQQKGFGVMSQRQVGKSMVSGVGGVRVNQSINSGQPYKSQRMLSFRNRPLTAQPYKSIASRPVAPQSASTNTNTHNFNNGIPSHRQKAFLQISRGNYQFDNHKNPSTTNVSSMRDLHRIYEPPLPKHQIPINNPFYNHTLVQRSGTNTNNPDHLPLSSMRLSQRKSSPRSLLNWISSPNTKRVQQKMVNRISYLQVLSQNKNAYTSDIAQVVDNDSEGNPLSHSSSAVEVKAKMDKLLKLAEDPKVYHQAVEHLMRKEGERGNIRQDHLFEDKYIISEKTMMSGSGMVNSNKYNY